MRKRHKNSRIAWPVPENARGGVEVRRRDVWETGRQGTSWVMVFPTAQYGKRMTSDARAVEHGRHASSAQRESPKAEAPSGRRMRQSARISAVSAQLLVH